MFIIHCSRIFCNPEDTQIRKERILFFMDENKVDFEKMTPAERLKYEVAEEIGLADKVRQYGWRSLTAKESGRIGGLMTKKRREMKQDKKG